MASASRPGRKKKKNDDNKLTIPLHLLIEINKLTQWKEIGEGGCGKVFSVIHEDWGQLAVKKLGVTIVDEGLGITSKLKKEACVLSDLRHKNIIQFSGVLWNAPDFGLAMPLVAHGSLNKFIECYETGHLVKIDFLRQIGVGLNYLHSLPKPVIHGDLKIGNVLVDYGCVMKIADFGLSSWRQYQTTYSKTSKLRVLSTITHIPPEMWENPESKPEEPQDIYALGILSWELFSEKGAFEGCKNDMIIHYVENGKRPDCNDMGSDVWPELKELVQACWVQETNERPSVQEMRSSLAEIVAPIEKDVTRAKSQLLSVLNEDSEDEEELRAIDVEREREREKEREIQEQKDRKKMTEIEERELYVAKKEKQIREREEKLKELEVREQERREKEKREKDRKRKDAATRRPASSGDMQSAARHATHGSFTLRGSTAKSTIHLVQYTGSRTGKVKEISPKAVVWGWARPDLTGMDLTWVGHGWSAAVAGLQMMEDQGHRTVAVVPAFPFGTDVSITGLTDHMALQRPSAAVHIWAVSGSQKYVSQWQRELQNDPRYKRIK